MAAVASSPAQARRPPRSSSAPIPAADERDAETAPAAGTAGAKSSLAEPPKKMKKKDEKEKKTATASPASATRPSGESPPLARPQTRKLRVVRNNSREWALETTTCLSLGLDPRDPDHQPVICNNCVLFWQKKLKSQIKNYNTEQRSRRMRCEQPFACDNNATQPKRHARDRLKKLFSVGEEPSGPHVSVVSERCNTPSGPRPSVLSGSSSTKKHAGGRPRLSDDSGSLTVKD